MAEDKGAAAGGELDPKLLEHPGLPADQGPLRYDRARSELVSEQAGLAYPIRDGIPIMLVDEARAARRGRPHPARGEGR